MMNEAKNPLVSVILPAFNAENFIASAISSVMDQSWEHWELLIVNDGSTDATGTVIKSFEDQRIQYFEQVNRGVSSARNKGLDEASGDFVVFLDADDMLSPDSLKTRILLLEQNPKARFCDGRIEVYDENMTCIDSEWCPNPVAPAGLLDDLLTLKGNVFFGLTWMIRNNPPSSLRFKPGLTHGEDLLYFIEQVVEGGEYIYTDKPVLKVRRGHASAMQNLRGLEKGYRQIADTLENMELIPGNLVRAYRKKAKSIMFKSYLGAGKPLAAIKTLIRK